MKVKVGDFINSKLITFWSPVKRQGCSTNIALYASYLSHVMDETEKAVIFSINEGIDALDYLTSNSIRNGMNDLLFLNEMNNINSKEDVLVYTHKVSENLDVLGTGKNKKKIDKEYKKILELLNMSYNYILIDSCTDNDITTTEILKISDLIVICMQQDKFVYESLDLSIFKDKKVICLSSLHNYKSELNISKLQMLMPMQVYPLCQSDKIGQAVNMQNIYNFINSEYKKKSNIIIELNEICKEIHRLINLENLNITYEIKKQKNYNDQQLETNEINKPEIKVIKEYKVIKAKNNIAIMNLSEGAGSTFITLNIAYMLKDKNVDVAVIEIPHKDMKADIYNIISDGDDNYISVAEMINSNTLNTSKNNSFMKNNIKFYINNGRIDNWNMDNNMEFINIISKDSTINIYDIGSREIDENISFLLNIIDVVIVIIDPMPYKLLQSEERINLINKLEERNINVVYALNKYIKDLNKKDIEKYLNIKISSLIPFIEPETMYAANYSNQSVYHFKKDEIFQESLSRILNQANILEYENQNKIKKFKLFKWRK
ncbi:hypothetical protein [Sedimentibacter sp. MB31-C6]|uniref:hypothetical protein n=1 Tax=Sedimentibacter sp. MB31-C6 TaxID=3109366 RepID=UPI002DDD030C|nr:hypothetical protein [Sedimentibacter sp. MB36-C1]WSI05136.1 hypothetical protein U8307_04915 [Sedimentibacter sp. MB36-C1]